MNVAAAGLLSALLATLRPVAIPAPGQASPTAERIESGEILSAGGDTLSYRIRLLPLASFPDLPPPVAAQLARLGCMIPQTFEAHEPENVIHGAFRAAGSDDWAALCSSAGTTTLYVFFSSQDDAPIALRSQPDTAWLGAEPGSSVFGSAWGISVTPAAELRDTPQLHGPAVFDHDAIADARLERSLTLRYHQDGRWLALNPGG